MRIVRAAQVRLNLMHQMFPSADFYQTQNGYQKRSGPNEHELQNFVEDRRAQSAQCNVYSNNDGGEPDAEIQIPIENDLHDERHRVHVDATHQNRHECETYRGKRPCGLPKAQIQISRDGVGL